LRAIKDALMPASLPRKSEVSFLVRIRRGSPGHLLTLAFDRRLPASILGAVGWLLRSNDKDWPQTGNSQIDFYYR